MFLTRLLQGEYIQEHIMLSDSHCHNSPCNLCKSRLFTAIKSAQCEISELQITNLHENHTTVRINVFNCTHRTLVFFVTSTSNSSLVELLILLVT